MRRYTEKIKVVPDEVRRTCRFKGFAPIPSLTPSPFDVLTESEDEVHSLALSGLHHLHGEAGHVLRLRRHPAAQRPQARAGGQTWQVWPHVPSAVPGGHVQQWQQGG